MNLSEKIIQRQLFITLLLPLTLPFPTSLHSVAAPYTKHSLEVKAIFIPTKFKYNKKMQRTINSNSILVSLYLFIFLPLKILLDPINNRLAFHITFKVSTLLKLISLLHIVHYCNANHSKDPNQTKSQISVCLGRANT